MADRRSLRGILLAVGLVVGAGGLGAPGAAAAQPAPEKPVIYNWSLEPGAVLDEIMHQTYDAAFQVVDFTDRDHIYVPPHLTAETAPIAPVDASGRLIEGKVVVFFIITAAGRVAHPVILRSSDPRLSAAVLKALAHRVYEPAWIDGRNVAMATGEEVGLPPSEL